MHTGHNGFLFEPGISSDLGKEAPSHIKVCQTISTSKLFEVQLTIKRSFTPYKTQKR